MSGTPHPPAPPRTTRVTRLVDAVPIWMRQFVKFAIVGGTGTVVNLAVFWLIIQIYAHAVGPRPLIVEQLASGAAFCVAVVNNYLLNRRWTFRHTGRFVIHFSRFFVVSCVGMGLNVLFYTLMHEYVGTGEVISQLLAIICVTPFNFLGSKFWAFR